MTFRASYSNQAVRFLKNADKGLAGRILEKIEELSIDPVGGDTKKLQGSKSLFRVRVGFVRILYEIDYAGKQIGIVKIDKRDSVYD